MTERVFSNPGAPGKRVASNPHNGDALPKAVSFSWRRNAAITCIALIAGMTMLVVASAATPSRVTKIRISKKAGLDIPWPQLTTPKYFLEIWTEGREGITTGVKQNPIGNGLTFDLPRPIPLSSMEEVKVKSKNMISTQISDRVDVRGQPELAGDKYWFKMICATSRTQSVLYFFAWCSIVVGVVAGAVLAVRFTYWQAI